MESESCRVFEKNQTVRLPGSEEEKTDNMFRRFNRMLQSGRHELVGITKKNEKQEKLKMQF